MVLRRVFIVVQPETLFLSLQHKKVLLRSLPRWCGDGMKVYQPYLPNTRATRRPYLYVQAAAHCRGLLRGPVHQGQA